MGNKLLSTIVRECEPLRRVIEPVEFAPGQEIYSAGGVIRHLYFPTRGVLSSIMELRGGGTAETLTVGNEGVVGLSVWLGVKRSQERVLQQGAGEVLRVSAREFCHCIRGRPRIELVLKHFLAYSLRFAAQNAACTSHHSLRQRVCRWLLGSFERAGSSELRLSHALLAHLLGARRQRVSEVTADLQRHGLIRYQRTSIRLLDRVALEKCACECFEELRASYARLCEQTL